MGTASLSVTACWSAASRSSMSRAGSVPLPRSQADVLGPLQGQDEAAGVAAELAELVNLLALDELGADHLPGQRTRRRPPQEEQRAAGRQDLRLDHPHDLALAVQVGAALAAGQRAIVERVVLDLELRPWSQPALERLHHPAAHAGGRQVPARLPDRPGREALLLAEHDRLRKEDERVHAVVRDGPGLDGRRYRQQQGGAEAEQTGPHGNRRDDDGTMMPGQEERCLDKHRFLNALPYRAPSLGWQ